MSRRSSVLVALGLAGCMPAYDPIVICHNGNCDGTGAFEDDTLDALRASLALADGERPLFDGIELDTFLFFNARTKQSTCLFAHDDLDPEGAARPIEAAQLVAEHLQKPLVSWNGERFYLKIELKPTVTGTENFHTASQAIMHAQCVLEMAHAATQRSPVPVTVIFDSTTECLHTEIEERRMLDEWLPLTTNPNVELLHSGPIVATRACIPVELDVRTFHVRAWRDTEIESIRPAMVWLDRNSENTETVKIIRHIRPEYVTTSAVPYVRGWVEGYQ